MPNDVMVYVLDNHRRSALICDAMMEGIRLTGDRPKLRRAERYTEPEAPVAVFYGLEPVLAKALAEYPAAGAKAVYVDLGYWGRHDGGRWAGYHKVSVNDRHPTAYFQNVKHSGERVAIFGTMPAKWKKGGKILLAGMGDKGAIAEGYKPEEWERRTIAELRKHTDREIIYRPKPSWKMAKPIDGVGYSVKDEEIEDVLRECHAVVTHHSNAAVDGLVRGVPAFCWKGVAMPLALQDLSKIESPLRPAGRTQWMADIAWCQWNISEMSRGLPWRHLKNEGLIP